MTEAMREQIQALADEWRDECESKKRSETANEAWAFGYAAKELEAILTTSPPVVSVKPGWACKDWDGLHWFDGKPSWDEYCGWGGSPEWVIRHCEADCLTDPWPDKPNGGPECVMEVK